MLRHDHSPFDFLSPLDARYYGADAGFYEALRPYLSEAAGIDYQLKVERALLAELERSGIAPEGTSARLATALEEDPVTPAEVYEEEGRIHHNVRALVHCIRRRLPDEAQGAVHLFATSNDVTDTARALALRDVTRDVLLPDLHALLGTLVERALEHAETPQIGRTHGRHAVPLTAGYWLVNYVDRLGQRIEKVAGAAAELRGMLSGAVGAHNSFALRWPDDPAALERHVLARLGMEPSEGAVSTQVVQAEYVVDFAHAVVSAFSVLADLADDCRHLMRSEIEELGEETTADHVGSSTMPHKVNPKDFENVKSLWKVAAPRMTTVYMDQLSEHQRDLTNSASGRFTGELVALFDHAVRRLDKAVKKTVLDREALRRNFEAGRQWTVAEPLYIALALAGREDAYDVSKALVRACREQGMGLLDYLHTAEGAAVLDDLSPEHQRVILDPARYLGDAAERTRKVCAAWWGEDDAPGRVNPLDPLASKLARPAEESVFRTA